MPLPFLRILKVVDVAAKRSHQNLAKLIVAAIVNVLGAIAGQVARTLAAPLADKAVAFAAVAGLI